MKDRQFEIDFIKTISIIGIILVHSSQRFKGIFEPLRYATNIGQIGCQCFLFITGYLTWRSWERHIEYCTDENRTKPIGFLWNKVKILLPGWYVVLALNLSVNLIRGGAVDYRGYVVNALLLNGLVPQYNNNIVAGGWYVGTLVLFYILFVIIRPRISRGVFFKYGDIASLAISIGFCLIGKLFLNLKIENNTFVYFNMLVQLPVLYLGMKYAYKGKELCLSTRKNMIYGISSFVVAVVLLTSGVGAVLSPYFIGKFMEHFLPLVKTINLKNWYINKMIISISGCTYYMYLINIPLLYTLMPFFRRCFVENLGFEVNVSYILSLIIMMILTYTIGMVFKLTIQTACKLLVKKCCG